MPDKSISLLDTQGDALTLWINRQDNGVKLVALLETTYVQENDKGAIVKGIVKEVDAKGAIITLADDIEATLKASEISRDRVEDARNVLKEGQEVEAKIISVDRKSRVIQLSIKSKDDAEEKEAIQSLKTAPEGEAAADTTMAALLRQAMAKQN